MVLAGERRLGGGPMNKELKAKWIEALRSNKYTQCQGRLRTKDNRFCALGVLADVYDNTQWALKNKSCHYSKYAGTDVRKLMTQHVWENVKYMNDDLGKSFSDIADYLDA